MWWDALGNYLTALDYAVGGENLSRWWTNASRLVGRYGTDAVRWWLLREVPRGADADFTIDRLVARANDELADGFGNLVNRVVSMIHRYRSGYVPARSVSAPGRGRSRGGHQQRSRLDRRGAGRLRLPPRHRGGLADSG